MIRNRSIGFQVTAWYFVVFSIVLMGFGAVSWIALERSVNEAVDDQLEDRARGLQVFLERQGPSPSVPRIRSTLADYSLLGFGGSVMQLCDEDGNWLYRSAVLEEGGVPIRKPRSLRTPGFETVEVDMHPVRLYSRAVSVEGRLYSVQVGASVDEAYEAVQRFRGLMIVVFPLVLIGACAGGYWISSRALAPFDRISSAARRISIGNLGERLSVPRTADQLERLSETLNQMFARLEASVKRITQFTADASHELRTPITLIRTTAEIELMRDRSANEYRETLRDILHESERASEIVESLMMLARSDAGTGSGERTELDLRTIVQEVAGAGERLASNAGLAFEADVPETKLPVSADPSAVRRALLVIVDNAMKYTPRGGSVRMTAGMLDGFAVVEVSDTGIGIARDDLPLVFDRFWRADKARTREQGGAGLGLAIAKQIIEQHSGTITVESEIGTGSTFSCRIPLSAHAPTGRANRRVTSGTTR